MTKKCFYCGDALTEGHFMLDHAIKIMPETYAHTDCIAERGDGSIVSDQTQHVLGAADSAHQGIELARSLLQESLGSMGEILTQGCMNLESASLGCTMRLGQKLKEFAFLLDDLLKDAHGLCVLLGCDLGVCEDEVTVLSPGPECPSDTTQYLFDVLGIEPDDCAPREDEFDDDEQPF